MFCNSCKKERDIERFSWRTCVYKKKDGTIKRYHYRRKICSHCRNGVSEDKIRGAKVEDNTDYMSLVNRINSEFNK